MDDLKNFCCQNPDCSDYGRRGLDNLRVCFRNGPNQVRRVLAKTGCERQAEIVALLTGIARPRMMGPL